jgi:hypothetical protein
MGFLKKSIFAQNPYVLAYGFGENCQFTVKIGRNSVFLGHDINISDWLHIIVMYSHF